MGRRRGADLRYGRILRARDERAACSVRSRARRACEPISARGDGRRLGCCGERSEPRPGSNGFPSRAACDSLLFFAFAFRCLALPMRCATGRFPCATSPRVSSPCLCFASRCVASPGLANAWRRAAPLCQRLAPPLLSLPFRRRTARINASLCPCFSAPNAALPVPFRSSRYNARALLGSAMRCHRPAWLCVSEALLVSTVRHRAVHRPCGS